MLFVRNDVFRKDVSIGLNNILYVYEIEKSCDIRVFLVLVLCFNKNGLNNLFFYLDVRLFVIYIISIIINFRLINSVKYSFNFNV